jgi:hypothetical protein
MPETTHKTSPIPAANRSRKRTSFAALPNLESWPADRSFNAPRMNASPANPDAAHTSTMKNKVTEVCSTANEF